MNPRLDPRPWSSRYHVLRGLRGALEDAFSGALSAGTTVIDLGCGTRPYEPLVLARGASYLGADLPGVPQADLPLSEQGRTTAADGSADVVLSTQVLEHVRDPAVYLSEARRLLRPEGTLILSTHGYWQYHPDPRDLWRWTGAGLRQEIQKAGFEVLTTRRILNLGAAGLQLLQDFLVRRVPDRPGRLVAAVLQSLVGLVNLIPSRGNEHDEHEAAVFVVVAKRIERLPEAIR